MEDTLLHTVATKFFLFYLHLISVFFFIKLLYNLNSRYKEQKKHSSQNYTLHF